MGMIYKAINYVKFFNYLINNQSNIFKKTILLASFKIKIMELGSSPNTLLAKKLKRRAGLIESKRTLSMLRVAMIKKALKEHPHATS